MHPGHALSSASVDKSNLIPVSIRSSCWILSESPQRILGQRREGQGVTKQCDVVGGASPCVIYFFYIFILNKYIPPINSCAKLMRLFTFAWERLKERTRTCSITITATIALDLDGISRRITSTFFLLKVGGRDPPPSCRFCRSQPSARSGRTADQYADARTERAPLPPIGSAKATRTASSVSDAD